LLDRFLVDGLPHAKRQALFADRPDVVEGTQQVAVKAAAAHQDGIAGGCFDLLGAVAGPVSADTKRRFAFEQINHNKVYAPLVVEMRGDGILLLRRTAGVLLQREVVEGYWRTDNPIAAQ